MFLRSWFPDEEDAGGRRDDESADMGHSWAGEVHQLIIYFCSFSYNLKKIIFLNAAFNFFWMQVSKHC